MEDKNYKKYIWNCHMSGDIWWLDYRPYNYEEWINNGKPQQGGVPLESMTKYKLY